MHYLLGKGKIMTGERIKVIARITARADKVPEVRSLLLSLIEPTQEENGCIQYQLFQNKSDPTDFTFVEEWVNDAAIDAHLATPHVRSTLVVAQPLLAKEPTICRYTLIS